MTEPIHPPTDPRDWNHAVFGPPTGLAGARTAPRPGVRRRRFLAGLLAGLLAAPTPGGVALAQPRTVAYEASEQGVTSRLNLRIDGASVGGNLVEGSLTLGVTATLQGQRLQGSMTDPGSGRSLLRFDGELRGDLLLLTVRPDAPNPTRTLTMRRVDTAAAPAAAAPRTDAAGGLDPAIVGRWRHESQINSPGGAGGFAAFSTVRILELSPDGRVRQWVRSAGGGGNWSHQGGETLEFSGRWQVRGAELWVQPEGRPDFVRAAAYRRVGERLVTESQQGRQIWER